MKCPNCEFVVATKKDICPRCEFDLRPYKKEHGLKITDPTTNYETLRRREKHQEAQQQNLKQLKRSTIISDSVQNLSPDQFSSRGSITRIRYLESLKKKPIPDEALNQISSSIQQNIDKAKTATSQIPTQFSEPEPTIEAPAKVKIEAPVETKPEKVVEIKVEVEKIAPVKIRPRPTAQEYEQVITDLGLSSRLELAEELIELEQALEQFEFKQKVSLNKKAKGNSAPQNYSLQIDNTSLLEALREFDSSAGYGLEEIVGDDASTSEISPLESEEPGAPSLVSRIGAILVDFVAITVLALLLSLISIPNDIAKSIIFDLKLFDFAALPHLATLLYCVIATSIFYNAIFTTAGMQTIGGKLFAIEVLTSERLELPFHKALLRSLAITTSLPTAGLAFLPALLKRQTLYEFFSDTLVQKAAVFVLADTEKFKENIYVIDEEA